MKKIMAIVFVMIVLAVPAASYNTFVSLKINSIACNVCSGTPTGVTGSSGTMWVDTASGCTSTGTGQLGAKSGINPVNAGLSYATNEVSLTSGNAFYVCLQLSTKSINSQNDVASCQGTLSSCGFDGICQGFDIAGGGDCQSLNTGTQSFAIIGDGASAPQKWSFGFIA